MCLSVEWGGVGWGGMGTWPHGAGLHTALIIVLHTGCVNNVHISGSFSAMCTGHGAKQYNKLKQYN